MRVYRIDPLHDPRWNQFTATHPLATIFHSAPWLDALRRTYRYEASVFTTSPPSEAITSGLVYCDVSSWLTGRRLVSLPFSDHCDVLTSGPNDQNQLLCALIERLKETGASYAEVRPVTPVLTSQTEFRESQEFFLHTLDLRPSAEDLFQSFHKDSVQRKIRRAERERLILEEGRSEVLLRSFCRLLLMTRRRHGFPPPPRDWFKNLIDCLGDQLTIRVAYKNTNAIAAIMTLKFRNTLVYKYGSSDPRFHSLGGMHSLIWRAAQAAKQEGLWQLDLGRSDTDNQGLVTFKDRWGTTRSKMSYFRHSLQPSRIAGSTTWSARMVRPLLEWMPNGILSAAGKMLYRHVG
jgi:Acetyltransferase (GNAT) domain